MLQHITLSELSELMGMGPIKAAKELHRPGKGEEVKVDKLDKVVKPGHLTFLIGAARSGKSTIATKWVSERTNRLVVSCDSIRMALYGIRYASTADIFVEAIEDVIVRMYLSQGFDVLVDETNTTDRRIKKCFGWDIKAEWEILDTPLEILKHRCHSTNQLDMLPIVERHYNNIRDLENRWHGDIRQNIERLRHEVRTDPPIKRIAL